MGPITVLPPQPLDSLYPMCAVGAIALVFMAVTGVARLVDPWLPTTQTRNFNSGQPRTQLGRNFEAYAVWSATANVSGPPVELHLQLIEVVNVSP